MNEYNYTEHCREISGFGVSYEAACRGMVVAGMHWFDQYPQADPKFHEYESITGIIVEDNPEAKSLTDVMSDAVGGNATGAMMQASVNHCIHARKVGWLPYIKEMEDHP